ncbi:MAG: glycosyltransferase, partial [Desulfovibrio sp.]|nr:glycosyltransferase [Desulfovibrio sp.]
RFQALGPREQGLGSISAEEIAQWARDGAVEYLGEAKDVRPHVASCSVLVLPSWREGTPTAVMEAMSMGRAAVVTDVPGCREVVRDGVNGFLVPAKNPPALARAMERFLREPGLARAMGAEGRRMAEAEFDAETVARNILKDMHVPA